MITWTILVVGLLAAVGAIVWSLRRSPSDPIDVSAEKGWLVRTLAHRPRIAAFVRRRLDPARAGGLLLTVGLGIVFALALVVGWLFDSLDEQSGFAQFDESIAEFGANNATSTSTAILEAITHLGGTTVVVTVAIVVALYGWWRYRNVHVALFVVAVVLGQAAVNNGLKLLIDRERPDVLQLAPWAGSSFPSGHTAAAAALWAAVALVLGLRARRGDRAMLAGAAALIASAVGATRALLGVHWLTDVIAGLAVGWAWFVVCAVAFGGRIMHLGEPRDEVVMATPRARRVFQQPSTNDSRS